MNCQHHSHNGESLRQVTRRHFFSECGLGVGKIALASMLARGLPLVAADDPAKPSATGPLAPKPPHFPAKAKRVIYMFMAGAPSQLDLFDYKPELQRLDGKPVPKEVIGNQRYAFISPNAAILSPRFKFSKYGQSGAELSEMLPHLSKIVDDICIVKSVTTDAFNHAPAQIFMNTGAMQPGRPSMGTWVTYGLGSECDDLPGFVVLSSGSGISGGASNWSCGFMPTAYQGVLFRSKGDPILAANNPPGVDNTMQRDTLDLIRSLNEKRHEAVGDPDIQARIGAYELAYRMQSSAPDLMDLSKESKETLELYGAEPGKPSFAMNCLLARRMCERGVRFINLYHEGWDHHSDVAGGLKGQCGATDRASAALVTDLKRLGMLDDTLVVWGGEFGRTPMVESNAALGRSKGRDHHPQAFTMWLAGGGIKKGTTLGKTDELGFHVVEDKVHIHDMQATILHMLGLEHTKLTFFFKGRDFRLTDVHGHIVKKMLA